MVSQDPTSSLSQATLKKDSCMHRVIADDVLWKEFKAKLESSGGITNARTQQILQEFILKDRQKREAAESAETAEEIATPTSKHASAPEPQREGLVGMVRNLSGGALKSIKALEKEIAEDDDSDDDLDIDGPNEEWGDIVDLPRQNQPPRLSILGLDGRRRSSAMSIASSAFSAACSAAAAAAEFDDDEYGEEPENQIIAGNSFVKQLERRLSIAASGQTAFGRRRSSAASIHSNYSRPRRSSSIASGGGGASVSSIYETSARNNLAACAINRAINTIGGDDNADALHHDRHDYNVAPPATENHADTPRARDLLGRAQSYIYAGHGVKRLSMSAATIRRQSLASEIAEHRPSNSTRGSRRSSVFALAAEELHEEKDES